MHWRARSGRFELRLTAPRGTRGLVGLPLASATIKVDGRRVTPQTPTGHDARPGYVYVDGVTAGEHNIVAAE